MQTCVFIKTSVLIDKSVFLITTCTRKKKICERAEWHRAMFGIVDIGTDILGKDTGKGIDTNNIGTGTSKERARARRNNIDARAARARERARAARASESSRCT